MFVQDDQFSNNQTKFLLIILFSQTHYVHSKQYFFLSYYIYVTTNKAIENRKKKLQL